MDSLFCLTITLDHWLLDLTDLRTFTQVCTTFHDAVRRNLAPLLLCDLDASTHSRLNLLTSAAAGWVPEKVIGVLSRVLRPLIRSRRAVSVCRPWYAASIIGSDESDSESDDESDGQSDCESDGESDGDMPAEESLFGSEYWDANVLVRVSGKWSVGQRAHAFRTLYPFVLVPRAGEEGEVLAPKHFRASEAHLLRSLWARRPDAERAVFLRAVLQGRSVWTVARALYCCFGPWHAPPHGWHSGDNARCVVAWTPGACPHCDDDADRPRRCSRCECATFEPSALASAVSLFVNDLMAREGVELVALLVNKWSAVEQAAFRSKFRLFDQTTASSPPPGTPTDEGGGGGQQQQQRFCDALHQPSKRTNTTTELHARVNCCSGSNVHVTAAATALHQHVLVVGA